MSPAGRNGSWNVRLPFDRVFAPKLDAGNLRAASVRPDLPNGGIPAASSTDEAGAAAAFRLMMPWTSLRSIGRRSVGVSVDRTIPLRQFIEAGGTVIAIGNSAVNLAAALTLPSRIT